MAPEDGDDRRAGDRDAAGPGDPDGSDGPADLRDGPRERDEPAGVAAPDERSGTTAERGEATTDRREPPGEDDGGLASVDRRLRQLGDRLDAVEATLERRETARRDERARTSHERLDEQRADLQALRAAVEAIEAELVAVRAALQEHLER